MATVHYNKAAATSFGASGIQSINGMDIQLFTNKREVRLQGWVDYDGKHHYTGAMISIPHHPEMLEEVAQALLNIAEGLKSKHRQ